MGYSLSVKKRLFAFLATIWILLSAMFLGVFGTVFRQDYYVFTLVFLAFFLFATVDIKRVVQMNNDGEDSLETEAEDDKEIEE